MSKRIPLTPVLLNKIRSAVNDPELDASNFAIYEARFLSTEPIKQNGFYNKARVATSTLQKMAEGFTTAGSAVALQIMHDTRVLPVGKVFAAETNVMSNGEVELRGMFYLPSTEADLAAKIDNSIVDEVSVGLGTEHILCSECGFDFKGEDATIMNYFTMTCGEGHVIGENGVHVRMTGAPEFNEMSLVYKGAAKDAKIFARARQTMSKEMKDRLAASAIGEASFLSTCYPMTEPQGENTMTAEFTALMAKYETGVSELAQTKTQLTAANEAKSALETQVATLSASLETSTAKITELEAAIASSTDKVDLAAAQAKLTATSEKLLPHVKAALIASGVAEADVPTDLVAAVTMIEEKGLKLHQVVGAGALANGTKADDELAAKQDHRKGSFKLSNHS